MKYLNMFVTVCIRYDPPDTRRRNLFKAIVQDICTSFLRQIFMNVHTRSCTIAHNRAVF